MAEVKLNGGKVAIVDDADLPLVSQWKNWKAVRGRRTWYARRRVDHGSKGRDYVWMHRLILGMAKGDGRQADHRNGNGLDNRRENLRECSTGQNHGNLPKYERKHTSAYKGVNWDGKRAKAMIQRRVISYFATEEEAARAYDEAARALWGEFAAVNFPREGERCAVTTWGQSSSLAAEPVIKP